MGRLRAEEEDQDDEEEVNEDDDDDSDNSDDGDMDQDDDCKLINIYKTDYFFGSIHGLHRESAMSYL